MQRRQFLHLTAAIAGSALLSRCAGHSPSSSVTSSVIQSQAGLLQMDLTAAPATLSLAGQPAHLIAYNQQVPGPRLELRPGDRVQIRFTNALSEPTNLHFHGLHISPTGQADNPLREVLPGATADYEFDLPVDHPRGLFWYHPHYHGLVAKQVFSGLAGMIVVREAPEEPSILPGVTEALLMLQDFDLSRWGRVRDPVPMFQMWGREGTLLTVNGQTAPMLDLPQSGQLQLRLLNASASRPYRLQLKDHPWYLMATDGHWLTAPVFQSELLLAPGERADFLVSGDQTPGTYDLLTLPYDRGIMGLLPQHNQWAMAKLPTITQPQQLAQIRYQPQTQPQAQRIPSTLTPIETLAEPETVREFVLDHGIDPDTHTQFLINGRGFNPQRVDTQVRLGAVEDWVITNQAGLDHSFHLHTNAFQVISRNGQPEPFRSWKDGINIPAYEQVRIRVSFRDFKGKTVYHCHTLDHEDQGMMGIVEIS